MTWRTLLAIDSDKWACATYRANFPGVDVRCARVADLIGELPDADVIVGGPPCQPFSQAGDREGDADDRNGIPDFINAVGRVRPRMFLMEQVPGFMTFQNGRYARSVHKELEQIGYLIQVRALDAVSFGVPQFRSRQWWWGIRANVKARHCWPKPTHSWPAPDACMFGSDLRPAITIRQALGIGYGPAGRIAGAKGWSGQRIVAGDEPSPTITGEGTNPEFIRVMGGGRNHPADVNGFYRRDKRDITDEPCTTITDYNGATTPFLAVAKTLDKPSPTISAGSHCGGPEPINNRIREGFIRRLTPQECFRLQSGTDEFIWPDGITKTNTYRIVGNGWASAMAWQMSQALKTADPLSETVVDLFCGGGLGAAGWHRKFWSYAAETACLHSNAHEPDETPPATCERCGAALERKEESDGH